ASDPKQRTWFVFDHCLVLPEYLVEFEYVMKNKAQPDPSGSFTQELVERGVLQPQNETEANDMGPLARSLVKFLYQCDTQASSSSSADEPTQKIISSLPVIPQRPPVSAITIDVLISQGGADMGAITHLNLHSNAIRRIENLSALVSLQTLVLSFNEITKMEGFEKTTTLTKLDLSYNQVRKLESLKTLSTLTHLDMNSNLVHRAEDLSMLRKYVPNLTTLNFATNPVCEMKSYRHYVLRRLLKLEMLDNHPVTPEEQRIAMAETSSIKTQMVKENAFIQRRSNWSLMPASFRRQGPTEREALSTDADDESWWERVQREALFKDADGESWWERVQDLELNSKHLRKLSNLERLVNLRVLSVCDNEIVAIQGLDRCVLLEELLMEENRITKIENLGSLHNLKKLDLGKNKITFVENLLSLSKLAQLSLEDNEVEALAGLAKLSTLLELYLGNNKVADLKEALNLKPLPKLIILDLSGNPVCQEPAYRLYSIFHLRKLKVLDGLGVETAEQTAANDTYAGRLTDEFLVEKLGHKFYEHVSELDLSSNKIRDTAACITGEMFPGLRVLNLDNNQISDPSGLTGLSCLVVLRLNHNRIDNVGPEKKAHPDAEPVGLQVLGVLRLNHNRIDNVGPEKKAHPDAEPVGLQTLSALEVLQLGFNDIHSLLPIKHLPLGALKGNDISKIDGLDGLSQLRELVLDKNKVRHVEPGALAALVNLREILDKNKVRHVEPGALAALGNLREILDKKKVRHVEPGALAPLVNLRELRMEENGLKSLANIGPLPRLHALHLGSNRVADINDLDKIASLPSVLDLTLSNNPLSRKQLYRATAIQKLQTLKILDNKEISAEERDRVDVLFSMETRSTPSYVASTAMAAPMQNNVSKVPIKMSSVTFDQLGGAVQQSHNLSIGGNSHGGHGAAAGGASFVCIGLSKSNETRGDGDWHPFHNSTGDFFLPAGKTSGRQRTAGITAMGKGGQPGRRGQQTGARRRIASQPIALGRGYRVLGTAAAAASAALEARAMASGLQGPGHRSRKLGHLLGAGVVSHLNPEP
ncbi:hypothetical protein T484DRAFT_1766595, partial [Baffinella frigidus]